MVLDLALRPVKDHVEFIVAVQHVDVFKVIFAIAGCGREGQQRAVAVKFCVPAGREFAAELGMVEGRGMGQRLVGDHHPAPALGAAAELARKSRDIANREMRGVCRPEQFAFGIGPVEGGADGLAAGAEPRLDRGAVGQGRKLSRGVDRGRAVDLDPGLGAVGNPAIDDELERRRAPHSIRQADMRERIEVERGVALERG